MLQELKTKFQVYSQFDKLYGASAMVTGTIRLWY